jgi:ABC-type antimicrobial peptide transport system permease subunit
MYTEPVTGSTFKLGITNATSFELKVSGIFEKPTASTVKADNREWIILTETAFETLIDEYIGAQNIIIYVHSITIIAGGDVFGGQAYNNVDAIADQYQSLADNPQYSTVDFVRKTAKDEQRNMMLLSLLFGLVGTFLVSTLYSYLITRFRRREVAVLKAMGYSKWDVRIVVLCEILVVAITGFLIGIFAIQLYLWNPLARRSSYVYLIIFSPTAFLSFIAVVISCVPGFIIITTRILSVRPSKGIYKREKRSSYGIERC